MKFIDTKGREHSIDIRPSRWEVKTEGSGRGVFQTKVGIILEELYPGDIILEEFPCYGERLFMDFFLPRRLLAVEVQGRQHREFVSFFHNTMADFKAQQKRDSVKQEWCDINNIKLVKIDTGTNEEKIRKAFT